MEFTEEEKAKLKDQFKENIKEVDQDDVDYASKKGRKKIEKLEDLPPGALKEIWAQLKLMVFLTNDYARGNYKDVPWQSIAAIVVAIIYFVSPIDLIPDAIPVVGYVDDAFVIKLALEFTRPDLIKYEKWRTENKVTDSN